VQLKIRVKSNGTTSPARDRLIATFEDLDKLAKEIARDVKTWAGRVPLRKQGSSYGLALIAEWVEPTPTKKKR
jgi:hypothetical protein